MILESDFERFIFHSANIILILSACYILNNEIKKYCKNKSPKNSHVLINKKLPQTELKSIKIDDKEEIKPLILKLPIAIKSSINQNQTIENTRSFRPF